MISKHPILPERVRKVPKQFSWLDQRLARHRYIDRCSHQASTLYLFLIAVSDAQGLSYYSDPTLLKRLKMESSLLDHARHELLGLELIAWKKPIYQVLGIGGGSQEVSRKIREAVDKRPLSIGQILKRITEDA